MPVAIRTSDGKEVLVQGTPAEVRERIKRSRGGLVDFKGKDDVEVCVNAQQITRLVEVSGPAWGPA